MKRFAAKNQRRGLITARISLIVLALIFITIGLFLDEPFTVLNKAIYICLECIGVG